MALTCVRCCISTRTTVTKVYLSELLILHCAWSCLLLPYNAALQDQGHSQVALAIPRGIRWHVCKAMREM